MEETKIKHKHLKNIFICLHLPYNLGLFAIFLHASGFLLEKYLYLNKSKHQQEFLDIKIG